MVLFAELALLRPLSMPRFTATRAPVTRRFRAIYPWIACPPLGEREVLYLHVSPSLLLQ